ncbi:hypothetical protein GGQ04_003215 [Salinibacter ruber]|nr:hypothetical protein [Salinibacter ruber]
MSFDAETASSETVIIHVGEALYQLPRMTVHV